LPVNLVFDLGAVLVQWQPQDLLRQHFPNEAASPEQAKALAGEFFHHADWMSFDRGTLPMDSVIARTGERLGLPGRSVASLVAGIGDYLTALPDTVALLARLRELRERDSSIRLYYLSNMPQPYARTLEQRHDFFQWFDGGVFSGDVNHIKPEAAIYELLESRYALQPERTVFIDDLALNIAAAQARGWHGIQFESAPQVQAELDAWMAVARSRVG
jgi:putative hydrolase of the HAD superfamily